MVLAGKPAPGMPGADAIQAAVTRLGLTDDVVFLGHAPDRLLPALYAGASVLAFPSRYEGFGFPLIEAMACGAPVVAAAGSSVSEVVADAGQLVPVDDAEALAAALYEVLTNPLTRERLRARGFARAAAFTWERTAQQTATVYHQVVAESRTGKNEQRARATVGAERSS